MTNDGSRRCDGDKATKEVSALWDGTVCGGWGRNKKVRPSRVGFRYL